MDQKDKNILTYCLSSILVMSLMSMMITVAQQGTGATQAGEYDMVSGIFISSTQQVQVINQTTYTEGDVGNFTVLNPVNSVFDPIGQSVNYIAGLGKMTGLISGTIVNMAGLAGYAAGVGGGIMGLMLGLIVVIWQFSVIYQLFKFLFPGRVR